MKNNVQNGRKPNAGRPVGIPAPVKPIDPEATVDIAVDSILQGKPLIPKSFAAGKRAPLTNNDRTRLNRAMGITVEEFNQKLGEKLALISDKIAQRIEEKIDEDQFKPGELGFIFSVTEDKRRALDARTQLGNSQVNIQVNNYGDKTREEILADLQIPFPGSTKPATPDPVPANPVSPDPVTPDPVFYGPVLPVQETEELNPEDVI